MDEDLNLHCYLCGGAIKSDADLGGSVGFVYGTFPLCVECCEEG